MSLSSAHRAKVNDLTISLSYIQSESHKNLTGDDDHSVEESTGRSVLSYTPHYFSGCPQSMVRNGHLPLTSLIFSMASSTTYSDERCSSVFVHSRACEFHLQLFGRQRGIAFRSSPVLALAVPVATNEKW